MSCCEASPSPRRFGDVRASRSQALPTNSLFGSVLERLGSAERRNLQHMDNPEVEAAARAFDAPKIRRGPEIALSPQQREALQQEHGQQLAAYRQEHHRLQEALRQSDHRLQDLQRHSRYHLDQPLNMPPKGELLRQGEARRRWLSLQDLQHAPEVNRVGLKPPGATLPKGFNRDKFGTKPPAHNYALIGDVLRPGMEFARREEDWEPISARFQPPGPETRCTRTKPKLLERKEAMQKLPPRTHVIPGSELEIPANIKHRFGSRVCEQLLCDPEKIRSSADLTAAKRASDEETSDERRGSQHATMNQNYASLSTNLRSNVFPGSTTGHHLGTTHRKHNSAVYARREAVPDQHRFQWDHVSRWNEANVLHCRVMKALEESRAAAK